RKSGGGIPMWVWFAGGGGLLAAAGIAVVFIFVLKGGGGNFSKVKEGMTRQEVEALLGEPAMSAMGLFSMYTDPPLKSSELNNESKRNKVKRVLFVLYENDRV